uniref:Uncharacterized protein n=1 Tax=Nicotiana tabacum TaxID=4097 RepID=A0A1S3ZEA7_TOBAC|nr:PREDICTED: uncharacterized protein LOC107785763 [Nicotiana tabacum]
MDGRSWKNLSHRFGWKVKNHGVSTESVVASKISLETAQEIILGYPSKRKAIVDQDSEEEKEQDGGSLIKRSRARRRIISDDEASPPHSIALIEPVEASLVISDDETPAATHDSTEQLFVRGFDSESLGPVSDEAPLASFSIYAPVIPSLLVMTVATAAPPPQAVLTPSTVPPTTVQQTEVGSSSGSGAMKQVIIEVPADGNLLGKSGGVDVWLKPLIGPIERDKLESHNSLTWMNDII